MEKIPTNPSFITPDLEKERGEIGRVAQEVFGLKDPEEIKKFGVRFSEAAKSTRLVELSEETWSQLENTDSYDIAPGDWAVVEDHAVAGHADHPRDWESLKVQYEQGAPIEAPVIVKTNNTLHLVAGNTRLMVARALGVTPQVLLVELNNSK